ncbi:DNA polymerase X family protein [Candidatus Koribacter versatilis Ellin345]|uniref:DNA polymerase beta n=1 Tax=Koribacter versatilis (strain Ellin345) TaxID=204669 RepID=Q1IP10_KORVE|nr:DNA polymerase/3'-5' exonuclease PolX [Candidatus Koribacter versatilis]ABF41390.1 DNA polymerase X family protein [Candidatus Koribacter versatilis Ellin345]
MENRQLANIFYETADLMEVQGDDPFRIRSYRRAAEALESQPTQIADIISDDKAVLAIPGIGKGMLLNLQEIFREGRLKLHAELLEKYRPSMLELLKIQGLGPKTIALIWSAFQVSDLAGVETLAREGKLRTLPRLSEKTEQKILKSIETYRSISGRFLIDTADQTAEKMIAHLREVKGVEKITPAGSLRRGRETVGDLDILVTGPCAKNEQQRDAVIEHILKFPGILDILVKGENKVSFKLRTGMQVDVRILPPESFGAAMQYFTGSKNHNVTLRQRALKMGYTLNEYGLAKLDDNSIVASHTEDEIYAKLGLDCPPPEMRENCGEIELADKHELPCLIEEKDIRGDVHMHTVETDGRNTIEEMAQAAKARGYEYIAITDHSKNLAMANGLDDRRALEHIKRIRRASDQLEGITIFAGIECDILADGAMDLSDEVLAQMDIVIASVHSHFSQERAEMTERVLKAIANPHVSLLGHPTGRLLLRRDAYALDMDAVMKAAAQHRVAMELNASPDRLDLSDVHLRMARERGIPLVINTDAHHTSHFDLLKYGILQARRAWLTKKNVLNTLPIEKFKQALKKDWSSAA